MLTGLNENCCSELDLSKSLFPDSQAFELPMNNLPALTELFGKGPEGGYKFERILNHALMAYATAAGFGYAKIGDHGGDHGVDGLASLGGVPTFDGPVAFQFKWLWDGIHKTTKARQITESIARAQSAFPDVRHYVLITPHELTKNERQWFDSRNQNPNCRLHHWGQTRVEWLLRQYAPDLLQEIFGERRRLSGTMFLATLGGILQFGGHLLSIGWDPLYAIILLSTGYSIGIAAFIWFRRKEVSRNRGLSHKPVQPHHWFLWLWGPAITILFAVHLILGFLQCQKPGINSAFAESGKGGRRRCIFSIVELFGVGRHGPKVYTLVGNKRYNFAEIPRSAGAPSGNVSGASCVLEFNAEPVARAAVVDVEGLAVIVDSYQPVPAHNESARPRGIQEARLFSASIDNPSAVGTNRFGAKLLYQQQEKLVWLRLERGKPEKVLVKVEAKTPGLYTFSILLSVRHKEIREAVVVARSEEFIFDY